MMLYHLCFICPFDRSLSDLQNKETSKTAIYNSWLFLK